MNDLPRIPLAGVIGSPIAQSKSPQLHGHWLKTYGIKGHYIPMDVAVEDLENVIRTLPKLGFVGVNITAPHKEHVMQLADIVTDRATQIGAANTITFQQDGKIHADNTDGYGFIENLKSGASNWDPCSGAAAILGAGGAARAVISSLLEAGVPKIKLANRTRQRAEQLQKDFGNHVQVYDWSQAGSMIDDAALLVNTTSLGMIGKDALNVSFDGLHAQTVVTDLVYAPLKTKMLEIAQNRGCETVDGLGMLLHQAVPGFERWFGQRPNVDNATRITALQ